MIHLGDITKLKGSDVPAVDVITGGSPCQDLSVAGKRAGLDGDRSGLFMEQIRLVKEMREHDRRTGRSGMYVRPRYCIWENVPGAFSSNGGKDFQAVLTEFARVAEPEAPDVPMPDKGKWPKSGCIYDELGRWSIAWRVHDAQFWGVPQRRKRIALVADFGGLTAPEILFERKGLSGDIEQGSETREGASGRTAESAGSAISFQERAGCPGGGKGILIQNERTGALSTLNNQSVCYGISSYDSNAMKSPNPHSGIYEADTSRTLDLNGGNPACNQGGMAVLCLNGQGGAVMNVSEDVSGCLRAQEHGHQPILLESNQNHATIQTDGISTTNTAQGGQRQPCVLTSTYQNVTGPLMANSHPGSYTGQDAYNDMLVTTLAAGGFGKYEQGVGVLRASGGDYGGGTETLVAGNIVRRLTPLECERLQGFPSGWTDIGDWTDSKGKRHKAADSPRYKALGNSIALPFWQFLARRICAQYERDITMASLFDGIGGFPLVFERCGAKAMWASEIEEFPMAVTRERFKEDA